MAKAASRHENESAAIAYVCQHWSQIHAWLTPGDQDLPSRLGKALRNGQPVSQVLDELHEAVQRGGDALGVYGNADRSQPRGPTGFGFPRPAQADVIFLCPRARCSRYATPEPGIAGPKPMCEVFGVPLQWERLDPWVGS
jgi:hypothetical protein